MKRRTTIGLLVAVFLSAACTPELTAPPGTEPGDVGSTEVQDADAEGVSDVDVQADDVEVAEDAQDVEEPPDLSWWTYEAGESYFGETGYIEFVAGDIPVVISASHGGYLEPDEVAERTSGVMVRDAFTQELTREMGDAFYELTGKRPHLIINLLARTHLDANRNIDEAAQGDPIAEAAWEEYHQFIEEAEAFSTQAFGRALYLDIHGHGHEEQRVELGYLLNGASLRQDDDVLNSDDTIDSTSIRTLFRDNEAEMTFVELLRGPKSYGAMLEARGFPSVPSASQPAPEPDWAFFSGGYNTRRWGSRDGSDMSGIQIEGNQDARFDPATRLDFAYALVESSLEYLREHFGIVVE